MVMIMMQVLVVVMVVITLAVAMISGSVCFCCNLQACRQAVVSSSSSSSSIPCLMSTRTHSSVSSTMDQILVLWVVAGCRGSHRMGKLRVGPLFSLVRGEDQKDQVTSQPSSALTRFGQDVIKSTGLHLGSKLLGPESQATLSTLCPSRMLGKARF